MLLALLQFELLIRGSECLKDKRRVVRSLKDRLHHEHQVSVAEVGAQNEIRRAELAVCLVSSDVAYASGVLDRIVEKLKSLRDAELGRCERRMIHAQELPESDLDSDGHPDWTEEDTARMTEGLERFRREAEGEAA